MHDFTDIVIQSPDNHHSLFYLWRGIEWLLVLLNHSLNSAAHIIDLHYLYKFVQITWWFVFSNAKIIDEHKIR